MTTIVTTNAELFDIVSALQDAADCLPDGSDARDNLFGLQRRILAAAEITEPEA